MDTHRNEFTAGPAGGEFAPGRVQPGFLALFLDRPVSDFLTKD